MTMGLSVVLLGVTVWAQGNVTATLQRLSGDQLMSLLLWAQRGLCW